MNLPEILAQKFKAACIAELEAVKPGNVHLLSDGHDMTVQDFLLSADVASDVIAIPDIGIGQRILRAVRATYAAVGCNTNLGIIILCSPLVQTALESDGLVTREHLERVLQSLNIQDAVDAFRAIRLANPGGLGRSERHDVSDTPTATLLECMRVASGHDMIALQYDNGYAEIYEGMAYFHKVSMRWDRPAWVVSALYLFFLANYPDSHIVRKFGSEVALTVKEQAKLHWEEFTSRENPKTYLRPLLDFDRELKEQGINPGTSADLTVATLFVDSLTQRFELV